MDEQAEQEKEDGMDRFFVGLLFTFDHLYVHKSFRLLERKFLFMRTTTIHP